MTMISEEEKRRRRDMSLDSIVESMPPQERESFNRQTMANQERRRANEIKARRDESESNSKREGKLLEKAERGLYGDMTKVQLQQAHSELDHWSKGHST